MKYRQSANLPTPFLLCVACCRQAAGRGGEEEVRRLSEGVDWQAVLIAARRHRVEALVYSAVTATCAPIPPAVESHLAVDARAIADLNLRAVAQSGRLLDAFEAAGISLLFFKGLTLGQLAYPNPFLKMSRDIDILIDLADIGAAARIMTSLGYRPEEPANLAELGQWHRTRKESVWSSGENELRVEVHTRLPDCPWMIPKVGLRSPRQSVSVAPQLALETLADDHLFAYLAVHGSLSGWHRLKWLSDFAAFAADRDHAKLYERAIELGARDSAGQALLLSAQLFGITLPTALAASLQADRRVQRLARIALHLLVRAPTDSDPVLRRFGTLPIHLSHLMLAPDWTTRWSEVTRKFRDARQNR